MPYVSVGKENSGNIDLYYEDHGSGKPVVLIHGWPLSGASWEKQVPALVEAGFRVITYDRRGFGNSSKPFSGYNYDTLAEDLHQVITKLDLKDAAIAGFSMGGGEVARYIAKHGKERVSRAIFISAIPPALLKSADNPEGVDETVFTGIEKAIVADRPSFLMQFLHDFYNLDVYRGKRITDQAVRDELERGGDRVAQGHARLRVGVARGFSHGSQEVRSADAGDPRRRGSHSAHRVDGQADA